MTDDPFHDAAETDFERGRLQRPPTARGYRVATFTDVFKRHGLTMTALAVLCLLAPGSGELLSTTTARAAQDPQPYLAGLAGLLLFFTLWSWRRYFTVWHQCQWLAYLLLISVVEEITFRLVLPALLSTTLPLVAATVVSNLTFAAIHYVTLRWRLVNCIATFLGGMGLSHLMGQGDLVLVIIVHWLGTFINTPAPPSPEKNAGN